MSILLHTQALYVLIFVKLLYDFQAPGYAFYQLWVNLLWPWFRAGSGDDELSDKDKKRQLKREKKLTRKVYN